MENIIEYHPNPKCMKTDVFWGAVAGRVHMHLQFPEPRSFNVCLTAGLLDSVYLFYDYVGQHWEPWPIPSRIGNIYIYIYIYIYIFPSFSIFQCSDQVIYIVHL